MKQDVELFCGNEKHGPPAHLSNNTNGEEEDDAELWKEEDAGPVGAVRGEDLYLLT